jgi:hypothetical protein
MFILLYSHSILYDSKPLIAREKKNTSCIETIIICHDLYGIVQIWGVIWEIAYDQKIEYIVNYTL